MANVVHPGEAPEVPDGLCSTLDVKCSTPVRLLKYLMVSAVHLMTNVVHPCVAPEVHDGLCSTLDVKCSALAGKCSTPK